MNMDESEPRPALGPARNKARLVELQKSVTKPKNANKKLDKTHEITEIQGKKSPTLPIHYNSPTTLQPNCNSVPSILRKQQHHQQQQRQHRVFKTNSSMMSASCSSDASSDSSRSEASTWWSSRQSLPIRRKQQQSPAAPAKVISDPGSVDAASSVKKRCPCITPSTDPCYAAFHDEEWGFPVHDDKEVFQDFDHVSVSKLNEKKITAPGSSASSLLSELKLRGE